MRSKRDLALQLLEGAYQTMVDNVENVSLAEALFVPQGGYRSILGTLKHTAGWCHVYRSYAFDPSPKHWKGIDWPRGLRDTIIPSQEYLADVIAWYKEAHHRWAEDLRKVEEAELDEPHPLHWGATEPLFDIVARIALHDAYHAGELNQVLSISRGEAWEEGEEVEENNISTVGHRVRPPWMSEEGV